MTRPAAYHAIAAAALAASVVGCFASPDLSQISCKTKEQCAPGYVCDSTTNKCRLASDAAVTVEAGPAGSDGLRDQAPASDGAGVMDALDQASGDAAKLDGGLVDSAPAEDAAPSEVTPTSDLPAREADTDAGSADMPADRAADIPAERDAPTGPDLGPDVPAGPPPIDAAPSGAAIGSACAKASECALGNCVDGVCCDSPCTGVCQSCALASSRGTCSFVTGAPQAGHGACSGSGACAGRCGGNSAACLYPGSGTSCGAASCSAGLATTAGSCDGTGSCTPGQTTTCGAFACGATACLTSCAGTSQCASGAACVGGSCTRCATGQTACEGACIDVGTSNTHCGSCTAAACAAGEQCTGGKCLLQDGRPCTSASQCASGVCPLFYLDSDGDTYPVQASGKGYCNVSSPPGAGYIFPSPDGKWDCYDSDPTVNPGVTDYFDTPNANYGWDWNCSGSVEKQTTEIATCLPNSSNDGCVSGQTTGTPSEDCGAIHLLPGCAATSTDPLTCTLFSGLAAGNVKCH